MKRTIVVEWMLAALAIIIGCTVGTKDRSSLDGEWLFKVDSLDRGLAEEWYAPKTDRSHWDRHQLPGFWDRYGNLASFDGVGWYARTFDIKDTARHMSVFFGGVDDDADIWLDGEKIGSHVGYSEPFSVELPPDLKPGKKELVVRVDDHGGPGGIYKPVTVVPRDRVLEMYKTKYSDLQARPSEDWVKDAVIYEVYLRSFSSTGTFKSLERRLPELKELGVTVLWLMPIHPVGELNRKGKLGSPYSVEDYYAVNPEFGTLDDFKSLVKATHDHGMKIIIDLVANHTAWDSKLVMEHPDWFTTNAEGAIVSPNADWSDVAGLNYKHHELRKYMMEMMKYWVRDIGIDGYRCDVAELVPADFWERARTELDKIKPIMMLSEGKLPEHHVQAFDLTYSWNVYDVLSKVIDGSTPANVFDDMLRAESYQFPKGSLRLRFNTNHDKNVKDAPAVIKFSPKGARTTAVLAFTYPGVPLIYNGEEVGNEKRLSLFEKVDIDWTKNLEFRAFYQVLTQLRSGHVALRRGDFTSVKNSDAQKVYTFLRRAGNDEVLVVINFSRERHGVQVDVPQFQSAEVKEYFTRAVVSPVNGRLSLDLAGLDYKVFVPHGERNRGAQ